MSRKRGYPILLGTWLSVETDTGRGILRGLAQLVRPLRQVHVVGFSRARPITRDEIRSRGVHGLIATLESEEDVTLVRGLGVPCVNVSNALASTPVPTVTTDDERVGQWAARYYLNRGYGHLAYCGSTLHAGSVARERAMRLEASLAGARFFSHDVPTQEIATRNPAGIIRRLRNWLTELPRPIGIFVTSDYVGVYLAEACDALHLSVPDQVALLGVGVDSTRLAFSTTGISSIELNAPRIGVLAGELLLKRIRSPATSAPRVLVPPVKVVTRESTDRHVVEDKAVAAALEFIRDRLGQAISVAEVVEASSLGRRLLERRFRAALKRGIYEEIQRQRHARAVELMLQPDLALAEIAYAAGYRNGRHLSISFRARTGTSPLLFRRRLLSGRRSAVPIP